VLNEGAAEAALFGASALEAYCTAVLAIISSASGDTTSAWSQASHAGQIALDHGLERSPGMAVVTAVQALTSASTGDRRRLPRIGTPHVASSLD
jgi:hypothetical protein